MASVALDDDIMHNFAVAFAKITVDKLNGIEFHGVYFGGVSETSEQADQIARECVNNIKGGTILPRVYKLTNTNNLIDIMYEAADKFEDMVKKMQEADTIMTKTSRK